MEIPEGLVEFLRKDMPEEYKEFFKKVWEKHGELNVCYTFDAEDLKKFGDPVDAGLTLEDLNFLPHPIHLREGMTVRNAMRRSGFCDGWTAIEIDDTWIELVVRTLNLKK